jgi:hypothetical protein
MLGIYFLLPRAKNGRARAYTLASRSFTEGGSSYRFGFNGMEHDRELKQHINMKRILYFALLLNSNIVLAQNNKESYKAWNYFLSELYPLDTFSGYRKIYIKDSISNYNDGLDKINNSDYVDEVIDGKLYDTYGRKLQDTSWRGMVG